VIAVAAVAAAVFTGLYTHYAAAQLSAMRQTLDEMRKSGAVATDQMWQAIGNINWLARGMDGSLKQAQLAMRASEKQSQSALDASIALSRLDRRPWIGITDSRLTQFEKGKPIKLDIREVNSGKTPAVGVRGCIRYAFSERLVPGPVKEWGRDYLTFEQTPFQPIAPQADTAQGIEISGSPVATQYDAVAGGFRILYIYGELHYSDTAGVTDGFTRFCLYLDARVPPKLSYCKEFNDLR
jgi:hypothetical protein